jgi:hypothetical protein
MRGYADCGVVAEQSSREIGRHIVLSDVHAVCARLDRQVYTVVHQERDTEATAQRGQSASMLDDALGGRSLFAKLNYVYSTQDAGFDEGQQVVAVGGAEVETAGRHLGPACHEAVFLTFAGVFAAAAFAANLAACFVALTLSRLAASTMSATERKLPRSP